MRSLQRRGFYATPNAAEDDFGDVMVPAFFFVAETFGVLSDFSLRTG